MSLPPYLNLYLPFSHYAIVAAIYENLGLTPQLPIKREIRKPNRRSVFELQVVAPLNFARINIESYGKNAVDEIMTELKELCLKKLKPLIHI